MSALPSPDPADTNWVTVEDANSTYGKLPDTPSKSFTQTFSTVDPPAFTPGGPIAVSRQFGDNVTDVFAIDRGGLLVVFYVSGSGHWKSTTGFGPEGFARRNAALAACQQFGAVNQTDIFVVAQNGQLNVFWIAGSTGVVSGPLAIGPTGLANSGAALAVSQQFGATNQTDVFLIDGKGQLNVFWTKSAPVRGTGARKKSALRVRDRPCQRQSRRMPAIRRYRSDRRLRGRQFRPAERILGQRCRRLERPAGNRS